MIPAVVGSNPIVPIRRIQIRRWFQRKRVRQRNRGAALGAIRRGSACHLSCGQAVNNRPVRGTALGPDLFFFAGWCNGSTAAWKGGRLSRPVPHWCTRCGTKPTRVQIPCPRFDIPAFRKGRDFACIGIIPWYTRVVVKMRSFKRINDQGVLRLLQSGVYLVDRNTGTVYGPTRRTIKPQRGKRLHHLHIRLYHNGGMRRISLGKLVWMSVTRTVLPRDWEIHHRDENPGNNSWENLIALHKEDHRKLHAAAEEPIPF